MTTKIGNIYVLRNERSTVVRSQRSVNLTWYSLICEELKHNFSTWKELKKNVYIHFICILF